MLKLTGSKGISFVTLFIRNILKLYCSHYHWCQPKAFERRNKRFSSSYTVPFPCSFLHNFHVKVPFERKGLTEIILWNWRFQRKIFFSLFNNSTSCINKTHYYNPRTFQSCHKIRDLEEIFPLLVDFYIGIVRKPYLP